MKATIVKKQGDDPYNSVTELKRAHDVRHLRICAHCKGLGDRREMVTLFPVDKDWHHGRCYIAIHGLHWFLRLPTGILANVTLGDIGVEAMRALLQEMERRVSE